MRNETFRQTGVASGALLISWSLLTYAASAALSGISAAAFGSHLIRVWDPSNTAGFLFLYAGGALAAAALGLLATGFSRIRKDLDFLPDGPARAFRLSRQSLLLAYALLVIAAISSLPGFFLKPSPMTAPLLILFFVSAAGSALAFILAILLPPHILMDRGLVKQLSLVAGVVGASAEIGLLGLSLRSVLVPGEGVSGWLAFGGFPLLNWNLPLGIAVAISALMLSWAYRTESMRRVVQRLGRSSPSGEPA